MPNQQEVGYVISIKESLAYLNGLPSVKITDLVENEQGVKGLVAGLLSDRVEVWILDEGVVFPGQMFKKVDNHLNLMVGPSLLGRAINPLGIPIDGKGSISKIQLSPYKLDTEPRGMSSRENIDTQLVSGISLVDMLIPVGKGQRQLIMGDPHSGKTSFLIDLIVSQALQSSICIYGSIGKPINQVRSLIDVLSATKALSRTLIIAASSSESSPLIFLTAGAVMSAAEYFQSQGQDVVVILDDLGVHAKIYREICLLAARPPGRESYPGDIFYTHSHLLEKAGKFSKAAGGGSITAFPVIEINENDFTTYIPTNLMSMTDGHYLFKSTLRAKGSRPAMDISLSVSRVGRQTQSTIQSLLSDKVRQILTQAKELETISHFSGELSGETQSTLRRKQLLEQLLTQDALFFIPLQVQVILMGLIFTSFFDKKDKLYLYKNKKTLVDYFGNNPNWKIFSQTVMKLKSVDKLISLLEESLPSLNEQFP